MNRANGTITVAATNYKPNSRLGWECLTAWKNVSRR